MLLSRREMLQSSGSLLAFLHMRESGEASMPPAGIDASLAHEFSKTDILDISPDGKKLCLSDRTSFTKIFVVEIGTWETIYTGHFERNPTFAKFFSDSLAQEELSRQSFSRKRLERIQ